MRFLVLLATLGTLVVACGGDEGEDVSELSNGELIAAYEETIPPAFDAYVAALKEGDSDRVCNELFTPTAVDAIEAESGEPCQLAVTHSTSIEISSAQFTLERLRPAANGDVLASYSMNDARGDPPVTFVALDGEWRVAYEADPAIVKERDRFERRARELESKLYGGE